MDLILKKAQQSSETQLLDDHMEPLTESYMQCEESCPAGILNKYFKRGLTEIANGKVGVILMAGGQGSRLGVTYPKGMYNVGLLSQKTLFQLQAERILKVQSLAKEFRGTEGKVVWYIMTSGPTVTDTRNFLERNKFFGLESTDVVIFEQGLLPCFDNNGKILMSDIGELAMAPDGNGGIFKALAVNGILEDMERRGVQYLHCHGVDNILIKVADPTFIGYCVESGADCGAKTICKINPSEKLGVLCIVNGKVQVVEYSEISEETASLRHPDGSLVYKAANICNYFFTSKFLQEVSGVDMPFHVAYKKIPYLNSDGEVVRPDQPNGIKMEKFIFDVFQYSKHFVAWEVPRYSDFSALKNDNDAGEECPDTVKRDLYRLHKLYLENVKVQVVGDEVEISPLTSYAGEGLEKYSRDTVTSPTIL